MAMRFDPRPEIFSLVFLACYLAILLRVDRNPALAWFLPLIQVLWVNTHGLFVLGPIVLACYLVARVAHHLRTIRVCPTRAWSERPGGTSYLSWPRSRSHVS